MLMQGFCNTRSDFLMEKTEVYEKNEKTYVNLLCFLLLPTNFWTCDFSYVISIGCICFVL